MNIMDVSDSAHCNLASPMSPPQSSQNNSAGSSQSSNFSHNNNNNNNNFISSNNNNDGTPVVDGRSFPNNQQGENWIEELMLSANFVPRRPFWQRKLPASFFTPPDPSLSNSASHSRESSIDLTSPLHQTPASPLSPTNCIAGTRKHTARCTPNQNKSTLENRIPPTCRNFQVIHNRAHSSPASLQLPLSIGPANDALTSTNNPNVSMAAVTAPIHARQFSHEIDVSKLPLPSGWEMGFDATSNRRYFIDHQNKRTTWTDPRVEYHNLHHQQLIPQHQRQQPVQQQQHAPADCGSSTSVHPPLSGPVPKADVFFNSHKNNESTSWFDPRLSKPLAQEKTSHQQIVFDTISKINGNPALTPASNFVINSITPQIEHTRTHSTSAIGSTSIPSNILVNNQSLITGSVGCLDDTFKNVSSLTSESNILRQRSLQLSDQYGIPLNQPINSLAGNRTINSFSVADTNNKVDPFLSNSSSSHIRGQSSDSGLSLSTFSIPRTPDDQRVSDTEIEPLRSTFASPEVNTDMSNAVEQSNTLEVENFSMMDFAAEELANFNFNDYGIDPEALFASSTRTGAWV